MLTRKYDLVTVRRKLLIGKGANISVTSNLGIESEVDLEALGGISSTDLAKIDGITNGTAAAGKALVTDASNNILGINVVSSSQLQTAAIYGNSGTLTVNGAGSAQGSAVRLLGGVSTTSGNAGGPAQLIGGTPGATGVGGAVSMVAAAGGTTSGAGGSAIITAGPGTAGNANGGPVIITSGAANGSGAAGTILMRGRASVKQGAATAKTVSATLTAAEVLAGIITVNQGAGATSALQLPLATGMDTALPDFAVDDAIDISVINISTVDAEDASVTTNTGWTLTGSMDFHAYSAAGSLNSSGILRLRKTGTGTWTAYRRA